MKISSPAIKLQPKRRIQKETKMKMEQLQCQGTIICCLIKAWFSDHEPIVVFCFFVSLHWYKERRYDNANYEYDKFFVLFVCIYKPLWVSPSFYHLKK